MRIAPLFLSATLAMATGACGARDADAVPAVAEVDLPRFMGDWYVIGNIPTWPERDAYDAVESYALRPDGRIQTTFRYRKGSFDAPLRTMRPVGTVRPGTGNAVWGMQFLWPFQAEYVITWLAPDYSQVVVARSKRDHAWIMARTPTISARDYQSHVDHLIDLGYSLDKLRKVPQRSQASRAAR